MPSTTPLSRTASQTSSVMSRTATPPVVRSCKLYPWTPFAKATKAHGCTCTPLYYSHHRHQGKVVREIVGANRKEAQRALDALRGDVARKRYRVLGDVQFETWADRWLAGF